MTTYFEQGYALLIGVTNNALCRLVLPMAGKNVEAVQRVLSHPEWCACLPDNAKILTGQETTHAGILDSREWLQKQSRSGTSGNSTAVAYYPGHGWGDASANPPEFFLIPCDMLKNRFGSSALRAQDCGEAVDTLQPRRLLVLLDRCHTGETR